MFKGGYFYSMTPWKKCERQGSDVFITVAINRVYFKEVTMMHACSHQTNLLNNGNLTFVVLESVKGVSIFPAHHSV